MGPRGPSRPPKYRKPTFAKTIKKHIGFFRFWGVQGRPRQPWRSQEAAQEAPEELQDLKENELENGPDFYQFSD